MKEKKATDQAQSPDQQSNLETPIKQALTTDLSSYVSSPLRPALSALSVIRDSRGTGYVQIKNETTVHRLDRPETEIRIFRALAEAGYVLRQHELTELVEALKAMVQLLSETEDVWLRVAPIPGGVEIDVGDAANTRIVITPGRVEVGVGISQTLFHRTDIVAPFVMPAEEGDLDLLWPYLNLSAVHQILLLAWITYVLAHPKSAGVSFVILVLIGGQGCGKTTICRVIQALADPSRVGVQTFARTEEEFAITTQTAHMTIYDNVRSIRPSMADALCRGATGGALLKRKLYSNADVVMLPLHGPVILNGIHSFIDQTDLAQRSMVLTLLPIDEQQRRSESAINQDFARDLPRIFRGLLDLIAGVLLHLPDVEPTSPERMIDFVRWLAAMERFYGIPGDPYQSAYSDVLKQGMRDSLEENPLAAAVLELVDGISSTKWSGTPTELLEALCYRVSGRTLRSPEWPPNSIALSKRLHPLVPSLQQHGVEIHFDRGKHRQITITRLERNNHD